MPGGGITTAGQWKTTRSKGDFLFPTEQVSKVFKNKFMHKYRQWLHENNMQITNKLRQLLLPKNWVIYLKQPFGSLIRWWNIWVDTATKLRSPTTV
ncbi:MAG: transposase [Bacteroidetes bacterium]|nr:transposase [Bacteroidota bacterium]